MPAVALALSLVCMGGGTAIKPNVATVSGSQSGTYDYGRGGYSGSSSATIVGRRTQDYADQVDVELNGSNGRIRLPRVVLPTIHGGDGGWFELKHLRVTDRAIEGSAGVNFISHPKVHIDQLTGSISIAGRAGTYVGSCEAVDRDAQRKF